MSELSDVIRSSLEGIKELNDVNNVIGNAIHTPSGVSIIPVAKITMGFIGGGADYGQKRLAGSQSFGGGSGTGISITPIAFLTIDKLGGVNLLPISKDSTGPEKFLSLLEQAPDIINRFKSSSES